MGVVEEFATKFHTLEGVRIGEKRKSFNKLLHEYSSILTDENQNRTILAKITPQNYMEDIFRVEYLTYCQLIPELCNILKGGNEIHIKKVIKHDWFFQKAFKDLDAHKIVEDLLPNLSFSIRMKVIKKFVLFLKDEEKVYQIFDLVKQRYGLRIALPLLLGCSEDKVRYVMKNSPVFLSIGQLKLLIRKYPKLLPVYVEEHIKHKNDSSFLNDYDILRLIESKDQTIYNFLTEKYNLKVKYGRRKTKKVFHTQKDAILSNPKEYASRFEKAAFIRKLVAKGGFKQYLISFFPKSVNDFSNGSIYHLLSSVLCHVPKKRRFDFLQECFEEMYKVPLLECYDKIDSTVLDIILDVKKRDEIAMKKMQLEDDIEFLIYQTTDKSIPFFKKQMNLASDISQRQRLIKFLIKTCEKNNDKAALLEVCKYVSFRHRNDVEILSTFFTTLRHSFKLNEFSKEFWDVLNDLVDVYIMKRDSIYDVDHYIVSYIEFMYNAGNPIEELLLKMLEKSTAADYIYAHRTKNYKFIKDMIEASIELFPRVLKPDKLSSHYFSFISSIHSWNDSHPEYSIDYLSNPRFVDAIKFMFETKEELCYDSTRYILCRKGPDNITELVNLYMKKHLEHTNAIVLSYFLKWYPDMLANFWSSLLTAMCKTYGTTKLLINIKKYDYIDIRRNLITEIQRKLTEEDESVTNKFTTRALSILMHPEDYLNYVDKYRPKSLTVDIKSDEEKKLYDLQKYIVNSFKHINSPVVLPAIMSYSGGDHLRNVLPPLYKAFYHNPENLLLPFLDQLEKKPVSVRKHAVFLSCRICSLERVRKILKSVAAFEKNMSLQRLFMLATFKCFIKNTSDEFWELFKINLTYIDDTDTDSFETLVNQKYIPTAYISTYYQEIWNFIEGRAINEKCRHNLRSSLLRNMKPHIEQLPFELCTEMITKQFPKVPSDSSVNPFLFDYLLKRKEQNRFDKVIELCNSTKNANLEDAKKRKEVKKKMCIFIEDICEYYFKTYKSKQWDRNLLQKFFNILKNMYLDVEFFEQYILLSLALICVSETELSMEAYALKVSSLCKTLISKYGSHILTYLADVIERSLNYLKVNFEKFDNMKIKFAKSLLVADFSVENQFISFKIMSTCEETDEYHEVLEKLKASGDYFIQIELHVADLID